MSLLRKENGQLKVLSGANASGLPIGTIIPIYSIRVPVGFLPCDGSQYDTTQYPELYLLLGSDRLPDLRESTLVGIGASDRTDIAEHDVYTLGQFKDDQIQNITGKFTADSLTAGVEFSGAFTNTIYGYINLDTGGAGNALQHIDFDASKAARAGTTTHGKQTGVFFVIKAVTGLTTGSGESIEVANAIETATDGLEQYIVDNCETLVENALGSMHYNILPLTVDSTRHVSIDSSLLQGVNYKFRQTFADQATGTWTIQNTGNYDISVSRYGGRGSSAVDRVVTFSTIAAGASETFILDSDDPYLDSNTFSLEAIRCS
jgi:hypothetical protein